MAQEEIAHHLIDNVLAEGTWMIGPGTTTGVVLALLGLEKTLLGVDVVRAGGCLIADADERTLLELLAVRRMRASSVTPVGGQGFLFGRGNQQLSARVIETGRPGANRRRRHRGEDRPPRWGSTARRHRRSRHRRAASPATPVSSSATTARSSIRSPDDRPRGGHHLSDAPPAHPYIPNSAPGIKRAMLDAIGAKTVEELYELDSRAAPRPADCSTCPSRCARSTRCAAMSRGVLDRNESASERLSFLGGGCWPHYVPAVCDEIVNRGEFLTAYYGDTYGDHGKLQALFEYASMIGELVECDAVSQPTYDWGCRRRDMPSAWRPASRADAIALVPASIGAERRSLIEGYCEPWVEIVTIPFEPTHRAARARPRPGRALGRHRVRLPRDAGLSRRRSRRRPRRSRRRLGRRAR